METRSIEVDGRVFRLQLERSFWNCLDEIIEGLNISIQWLISSCWSCRPDDIASSLRVFVLEHYQQQVGLEVLAAAGPSSSKH